MPGAILLTGASGFIGQHLVAELHRQGMPLAPPVRYEVGPRTDWTAALKGVESVVHLAALAHERAQALGNQRGHQRLVEVNALGTQSLASAAAKAGVRHFIFLSTIGVCGEQTFADPFTELSPAAPRSAYAASKLEAERLLATVAAEQPLRVTVLRPSLVYGPGNPGNMLRLLELIHRGWPLPLGAVDNRRSLTGVHNLVSSIVALLRSAGPSDCFVVADAQSLSTADIVRALAAGMQRPARLVRVPVHVLRAAAFAFGQGDLARRLLGSLEVDATKLSRFTGWSPSVSTSDGLCETGKWFRRR